MNQTTKKFVGIIGFGLTVLALGSCGGPSENPVDTSALGIPSNNPYPGFHGRDFSGEKNLAKLLNAYPQGKPEPTPWAGFWWPYTSNGISSGTYGSGASPAGKYDAARGNRTNAQGWEVKNHGAGVPKVQQWWGHCNGWCAASALFPEPHEAVKVNGITFSVADIKALLTEASMEASADFYGERVDFAQDYYTPKYDDVIPDQYFLILTNYVGKLKQAVLLDRFTGDQVWNQPLVGYRFEYPKPTDYLGADPQNPNVYRLNLTSTIWWGRDDVSPGIQTPPFNYEDNEAFQSRTLKMEVWLDAPVVWDGDRIQSSGDIVVTRKGDYLFGGAWRNGSGFLNDAHPDYMWIPYSVLKPTEYANKDIDIEWIRAHILSGGVDDPTSGNATPRPVPSVAPSSNPSSSPMPIPRPSLSPAPAPTWTSSPRPTSTPRPWPTWP